MSNRQWTMGNRQGFTNCGVPDYRQTDAGLRIICQLRVANCRLILISGLSLHRQEHAGKTKGTF